MRRAVAAAVVVALVVFTLAGPAGARRRVRTWAPAETATIHPGVQTFTAGAQCTANFVFTSGGAVFLGQAAHCAGTGDATETDGCDSGSLPLGTPVEIEGATRPGALVYSSWLAMQAAGETDEPTCAFNDFALVRIDPADVALVNPSVPFWGGPVALDVDDTEAGERVVSYGNSSLRGGIEELSPKEGISLGTTDGWSHDVYTATPGIPGDSGSGFMDGEGDAIGSLSTLQIAPLVGSNGVTDLASALEYARAHSPFGGLTLVPGTEPFSPGGLLGLLG